MRETTPPPNGLTYWAFISYSHKDEDWAKWLVDALETYRLPKRLVGSRGDWGDVPPTLSPVFRDRDELSSAPSLSVRLEQALQESHCLIVLCSPESAISPWVALEIEVFERIGRANRITYLVVDGARQSSTGADQPGEECLPAVARLEEPLFIDARPGGDDRGTALLKVVAAVAGVNYAKLKERELCRQRRQNLLRGGALSVTLGTLVSAYVGLSDSGAPLPGSDAIRTHADRRNVSMFRRPASEAEVRRSAADLRRNLLGELIERSERPDFLETRTVDGEVVHLPSAWSVCQNCAGAFRVPELGRTDALRLSRWTEVIQRPEMFVPRGPLGAGWRGWQVDYTLAIISLWCEVASSRVSRSSADRETRTAVEQLGRSARLTSEVYWDPSTGAWYLFTQPLAGMESSYVAALALLALVESREAHGQPGGDEERRRFDLTFNWLVDHFESGPTAGWRAYVSVTDYPPVVDGLTLQAYATLLRAEMVSDRLVPEQIVAAMATHLQRLGGRRVSDPVQSGNFTQTIRTSSGEERFFNQPIRFLWYPWAVEACVAFLTRAPPHGVPPDVITAVRRALGQLVVAMHDELLAVARRPETPAYFLAETLYGLSAVPPP